MEYQSHHSDGISLIDYCRVVWKYRRMIATIVATVSVVAVVVSILLPKVYMAEAMIIPVSSKGNSGLAQMSSQFGGLAQLAGINLSGGSGDMEKFMAILQSRTIAENVIQRLNLMPILFKGKWDEKREKWKSDDPEKQPTLQEGAKLLKRKISIIDEKKKKLIKLSGKFRTPELAAKVVNTYIDEMQQIIKSNAFTTAKRNRIFIEGQLAENKRDLLEAGKEINAFYREKGISSSEAQVDIPVEGLTEGLSLGTVSGGLGDSQPKVITDMTLAARETGGPASDATAPIADLMARRAEVEGKLADARVVRAVPQQVYLSYLMLRRELLGKVNALLTTQYEMARIEESKEDLGFQVIDKAVPPYIRYSPKRSQICIMSFMAAFFCAIFLAFFWDYLKKMRDAVIR